MIIIFLALSLWLSYEVKSQRQELTHLQSSIAKTNNQNNILVYQLDILQEAFALNFGLSPESVLIQDLQNNPAGTTVTVLYLKSHACSPCSMPVIRRLIDQSWQNDGFLIVSHATNRHFLMQALSDDDLNNPQKVIWLSNPLYLRETTQYDAELLLIDNKGIITGLLPLELMKEEGLFASLPGMKIIGPD